MSQNSKELARLRKDISFLRASIDNLRVNRLGEITADEEFMRLWDLYGDIRARLILLDPNLFGDLREFAKPVTVKNMGYGDYQVTNTAQVKPLDNEVKKLSGYLEILEPKQPGFSQVDTLTWLRLLASRFHQVVRQLRNRYQDRPTLDVDDEYDVQNLLYALLRIGFDDIRPEERTPSYAGKSATMDFLLKKEQVVVETKKTRKGLGAKEVGDQLLIDIQRYQAHSDCKTLFCFVYDPDGRIANPIGIETDLSKTYNELDVIVQVEPKA